MLDLRKKHWNDLYASKKIEEVSWYQKVPQTSLDFILSSNILKNDPIIDIGGGDSFLVDFLLGNNFTDITVLDISDISIARAKDRLGARADDVNWVVSDICNFNVSREYALWHDRAVFHFLKEPDETNHYLQIVRKGIADNGKLILGTFSEKGPERCCSLDVKRYSTSDLSALFSKNFTCENKLNTIHRTPFGKEQAFSFVELIKNK
ncbi:MAG: class I SAM-dependent methyltransferase [Flavobacteriales bacterium]